MTEERETPLIEESHSPMEGWINSLIESGQVEEITPDAVRKALESHGAEFSISLEAQASLGKYTNRAKAEGMRAVWGDKFAEYKQWTKGYVQQYEQDPNNVPLPALKRSGRKNSGMIQFLGQLTSFAVGQLTFADFKRYTEARIYNGRCWAEGRKEDRIRIKVSTSENPILLSSIPPEFPKAAWGEIKDW